VFILVPLAGAPILMFYLPETKGLSLEEIGALFGDEVVQSTSGSGTGTSLDEKVHEHVAASVIPVEKA